MEEKNNATFLLAAEHKRFGEKESFNDGPSCLEN